LAEVENDEFDGRGEKVIKRHTRDQQERIVGDFRISWLATGDRQGAK
jgi:hypothetical protein